MWDQAEGSSSEAYGAGNTFVKGCSIESIFGTHSVNTYPLPKKIPPTVPRLIARHLLPTSPSPSKDAAPSWIATGWHSIGK